jgi:hypothetical protein
MQRATRAPFLSIALLKTLTALPGNGFGLIDWSQRSKFVVAAATHCVPFPGARLRHTVSARRKRCHDTAQRPTYATSSRKIERRRAGGRATSQAPSRTALERVVTDSCSTRFISRDARRASPLAGQNVLALLCRPHKPGDQVASRLLESGRERAAARRALLALTALRPRERRTSRVAARCRRWIRNRRRLTSKSLNVWFLIDWSASSRKRAALNKDSKTERRGEVRSCWLTFAARERDGRAKPQRCSEPCDCWAA